jgi:hypothetical protein
VILYKPHTVYCSLMIDMINCHRYDSCYARATNSHLTRLLDFLLCAASPMVPL